MSCRSAQEHRAKLAASVLESEPSVLGVETLEPSADPTARWTIELTIAADCCPPPVLAILAEYGFGTIDQNPQGGVYRVEAVAD